MNALAAVWLLVKKRVVFASHLACGYFAVQFLLQEKPAARIAAAMVTECFLVL
ncbi:MAG: hypothetical protein WCS94_12835 [Verrucomicrobiota bacterium]